MDTDGQPSHYCGEAGAQTSGSIGYTSQVVGFSDFIRHPLWKQHSLDSHMSHNDGDSVPDVSILRKWNYMPGQISSSSSSVSLSSDGDDKWQLKHVEFEKNSDSNVKKLGRSSTWSSLLISQVQFDKHRYPHPNLSLVPEIPSETAESVALIASLPVLTPAIAGLPELAVSETIRTTPDLSNMSKALPANVVPCNESIKSRTLCHETGGAFVFSARPAQAKCDIASSLFKETDSQSIFGLPSRINVTKRELNMMTPSSF